MTLDKRSAISEHAFHYHVNYAPSVIVDGKLPVVYGQRWMGADSRPQTRVTKWRGDPKPHTALYEPGFFRLPNEGNLVAPELGANMRTGNPTGGNRSKVRFAETSTVMNRLRAGIVPGSIPVVQTPPVNARAGPVYTQPER